MNEESIQRQIAVVEAAALRLEKEMNKLGADCIKYAATNKLGFRKTAYPRRATSEAAAAVGKAIEEIGALHGILERLAPEDMVQPLGPGDK